MKLLFFGDCMFGRNGNHFVLKPFKFVKQIIKQADYIFLNLETVISPKPLHDRYKTQKVFNYQSTGKPLLSLKLITKKPIFVSIANNHSLDYNTRGYKSTKKFLKNNNFLYASGKNSVCFNDICFINTSDHCGCNDKRKWGKNIWIIDHSNLDPVIIKIKNLVAKGKFIIFSIHWGPNYLDKISKEMKNTGRKLIDAGVNVVFGHSAHHIPLPPLELYKNGVIIYGLGDFVNDYAINEEYESNKSLMCMIDTKDNSVELIEIERQFISSSSIPKLV